MWKSDPTGGGAWLTCAAAAKVTPLAAVAEMVVVPTPVPVTTPVALTPAIAGLALAQVSGAPAIEAPLASKAVAVSVMFAPTLIAKLAGVTAMLAISAGGCVSPSSLQAPKVLAAGPLQTPAALRESEVPMGSVPTSNTPTSVDVIPFAAPLVAAKTPS